MIHWDRYIAIIGRITQRPEVWRQGRSGAFLQDKGSCGSACCVFGHADADQGIDQGHEDPDAAFDRGRKWFGMNERQARWVWSSGRNLAELQALAITQKFPWERAP